MKKYFKFSIILLMLNSFLYGQNSSTLNLANIERNNKIWTESQVLSMSSKFGIQDSFFTKSNKLKEKYNILYYLPQPNFDRYCSNLKEYWITTNDFDNYFLEMQSNNIIKIKDWLDLLVTYPKVSEGFIKDFGGGTLDGFNHFINELVKKEKLVFVDNGSVIITENTRENFNQYKHLKRLK